MALGKGRKAKGATKATPDLSAYQMVQLKNATEAK